MAIRDILVVIDNPANVGQLLAPAAALAGGSGARLIGLYAGGYPVESAYGDTSSNWMQLVESYLEAQRTEAAAAEAAFRGALAAKQLDGDWIYRESDPTDNAIALAALYDLVVLGQPDPEAEPAVARGLRPEAVVLGAGRPVLMVPYAGSFTEIGRRVLVAWSGTREAVRALHDAMFVLEGAESITVIEVEPTGGEPAGTGRLTAGDVAAALSRRGMTAHAESETAGDIGVDDLLLSRAADLAADLLVMGAYGHSRLREFVLGGVSRGIFRHMTLPVLLAH